MTPAPAVKPPAKSVFAGFAFADAVVWPFSLFATDPQLNGAIDTRGPYGADEVSGNLAVISGNLVQKFIAHASNKAISLQISDTEMA